MLLLQVRAASLFKLHGSLRRRRKVAGMAELMCYMPNRKERMALLCSLTRTPKSGVKTNNLTQLHSTELGSNNHLIHVA